MEVDLWMRAPPKWAGPEATEVGEVLVRWQRLFDDLEAQAEAYDAAEFEAEVSERIRYEAGQLRLIDRLRPAVDHQIDVGCQGVGRVQGRLARVGADWLLLAERADRQAMVAGAAIMSVGGLGAMSAVPGSEGKVGARLDFRRALRGVARDRSAVQALLVDGSLVTGTLDRVGADFIEVAEHPPGEPRRAATVSGVRAVPLTAVAIVRIG
jgi:hypothetical protein